MPPHQQFFQSQLLLQVQIITNKQHVTEAFLPRFKYDRLEYRSASSTVVAIGLWQSDEGTQIYGGLATGGVDLFHHIGTDFLSDCV